MPKVSIIVPVYNVERYIDKCLKSLVNQTLEDIEIIIVNDGSTDKSKEKIQKYIEKYSAKIKYFEKENGGLSVARNYGMRFAKGEYIGFLDSDDYVEKNMYEEMYKKAKEENSEMVECDFIWEYPLNPQKNKIDKRRKYKNKKEIIKRPRVMAWNKLIKREIIEKLNIEFPEGLIYEDLEFFYKLIPYISKISYVDKCLVHYIQRQNSISNNQTKKVEDIFKILNNIIEFYREKGIYEQYKEEINYACKRILLGSSMKRIVKIKDRKLKRRLINLSLEMVFKFSKRKRPQWEIFQKEASPIENGKKICFGITKLSIGGAERVLVDIVNKISDKYNITIFTIYSGGELEKELNKNIKLVSLYDDYKKIIPPYLLIFGKHVYNKFIKNKYDINIAFLEGPITRIFSYKGSGVKIVWVHNDIKRVFGNGIKAKIKKIIDKRIYKRYNKIIFVSKDNQKSFNELYGNMSEQEVVYNYIDRDRILRKAQDKIDEEDVEITKKQEPTILTVARLVEQKGIDRLIKVHKKLIDDGIKHKIYVIGDGEEKNKLQDLIKKFNVEKTFILLGKKENPYPYINVTDYFALLSYYEGYGMVIEEAKILDKYILITDTAAKEAVEGYEKSLVIDNNEKAIYYALKEVLQ